MNVIKIGFTMTDIVEYMTDRHRECDELFADAEAAVINANWTQANKMWQEFSAELEAHLQAEEQILFPKFQAATGMTSGPTQVMRMEHQQMRALIKVINKALSQQSKDEFLGLSETLMVLIQQHNMKEEMMLYPLSQQHIPNSSDIVDELQQRRQ